MRTLSYPPSQCPYCARPLAAYENIPLVSFLALRARCRTCGKPISWRYFWVELLTAVLFVALYHHFGRTADTVFYCLFTAALIAAFFIDLALFIIPDELNTFALLVGVGRDLWGVVHGEPQHALLWGWLPRSILGAMVCAGVFVAIQVFGNLLFRKDAMGDGDVKLARAIGALLPLSQALISFLLAIATGALLGGAMVGWQLFRARRVASVGPETESEGEIEEPEDLAATPLRDVLFMGALYLTFLDLLVGLAAWAKVPWAVRMMASESGIENEENFEEDFVAGPTHIPFGPYMVVGALLAVFVGDRLAHWYLVWAHLTA